MGSIFDARKARLLRRGTPSHYRSTVWQSPSETQRCEERIGRKLAIIQINCPCVVAGDYMPTLTEVLYTETMMAPMQDYFDWLQTKARAHLRIGGQTVFIKKQCRKIART